MFSLLTFTVVTNLISGALITLAYLFVPTISAIHPINLLLFNGLFFWIISTVIRISTKRIKKEWNTHEVIVTDPQIVLHSSSLAFKFLVSGLPGILGSVIWSIIYY